MLKKILSLIFFIYSYTAYSQVDVDSLKKKLSVVSHDTTKVKLLVEISEFYQKTEGDKSLDYGQKALALSQEINYQNGLIISYDNLGKFHARITSNYDLAQEYFEELLKLYIDTNSKINIAQTKNSLGVIAQFKGDYITSLEYLLESLEAFEKLNNEKRAALVVVNISSIYRFLKNYDKAREYNNRALEIYERIHKENPDDQRTHQKYAYTLLTLGVIYKENGNPDLALKNFQQALTIEEIYQVKNRIANVCNNVASAHYDLQDYQNAEKYYLRSLEERKSLGDNIGTSKTYNGLAETYRKLGKSSKALVFARKGFNLSNNLGAKENLKQSSFILYDLFKKENKIDSALYYFEINTITKDSLFNKEKNQQIGNLEHEFELRQKAFENEQQAVALAANEEALKFHQYLNIAVLVIAALITTLLIVIFNAYKNQAKFNRELISNRREITFQNAEIKSQNHSIIKQKDEFEKLNKIKDKLLSIISHDFKAPLNSLKGALNLLVMDALTPEEAKELTSQLKNKVDATSILLENILLWAKSQMQGLSIKAKEFEITDILDENLELFRFQLSQKSVHVQNYTLNSPILFADYDMINLVVRNIISNAVKFVNVHGELIISYSVTENFLELEIKNSGKGITLEGQQKLFDENSNYSTLGTNNEVGTGLGLLLCKEFIEANGGTIRVKSVLGKYTSFFFTVPITTKTDKAVQLERTPVDIDTN